MITVATRVSYSSGGKWGLALEIIYLDTEEPQDRLSEPIVRHTPRPSISPLRAAFTCFSLSHSVPQPLSIASASVGTGDEKVYKKEQQRPFEDVVPDASFTDFER